MAAVRGNDRVGESKMLHILNVLICALRGHRWKTVQRRTYNDVEWFPQRICDRCGATKW